MRCGRRLRVEQKAWFRDGEVLEGGKIALAAKRGCRKVCRTGGRFPQRLKPQCTDEAYGVTEVTPLQNSEFSAACKARNILTGFISRLKSFPLQNKEFLRSL